MKLVAICCLIALLMPSGAECTPLDARLSIVADPSADENYVFMNSVVGWDTFFAGGFYGQGRVIATVEAGLVWGGHEAFNRPTGHSTALAQSVTGTGALNEVDFHATMVAHVMAGTGYVADSDPAQFTFVGLGMAPLATIWSGAIATSYSAEDIGAFSTTDASVISVYRDFSQGIDGQRPDAINSSWGGADSAASSNVSLALDGLARQNSTVVFVSSAGNGGLLAVSAPGSNFNGLTVGSVGGTDFSTPSEFSSHGLTDFYLPNPDQPELATLVEGVRHSVHLVAPGENLFLAAYLGESGSLGASTNPQIVDLLSSPSPTDLYFLNQSGTSFSAPVVTGAIALLRNVAENDIFYHLNDTPMAMDSRVMKSILMASAAPTVGWDNQQTVQIIEGNTVITTEQGLDSRTGAGSLDLNNALEVFILSPTRDLPGLGGGLLSTSGWDFGSVMLNGHNDYRFENPFDTPIELSIALNWFAGRDFDEENNIGSNLFFADLQLQIWKMIEGEVSHLVAQSISIYNNTEFLRVYLASGSYGIRVLFNGLLFDWGETPRSSEEYALAWHATPVPEPTMGILLVFAFLLLTIYHRGPRHIRR